MSRHLQHDLQEAYHHLLSISGQVEEMIDNAVKSLMERRRDLADQVIGRDREIDSQEVRIEEECLKMLALHLLRKLERFITKKRLSVVFVAKLL